MNLILTPVYKNFDVTKQCCDAIDRNSTMPYLHILIDDNSGKEMDIPITRNRRIIYVKSDIPGLEHKNQLGQMLDLGYWYGTQAFWNEQPVEPFKYLFIIESDVVVKENWDQKMIDVSKTVPKNTVSLDCSSVDESGKITYPDTIAPRHTEKVGGLESLHYAMFQCTLVNHGYMVEHGIRFSDLPSHYDIMWSRKFQEKMNPLFLRTLDVQALHLNGGGSSRGLL